VKYLKKAPSHAAIDDVEGKIRDHYGKIYTEAALFQKEILEHEQSLDTFGKQICTITTSAGKTYGLRKICLNEEGFDEK